MKRKKTLRTFFRNYSEEILILLGFVLFLIGAYQIEPIAAWFVGGMECLLYSGLLGWSKRK